MARNPTLDLQTHELTPELAGDLFGFLSTAFPDNPGWATCYCCHYHLSEKGGAWKDRTGAQNRQTKADLIANGEAHGVLAYSAGEIVGWSHAAPKLSLLRLQDWAEDPDFPFGVEADETVGSFVCFVVAPGHRGRGVASRLIAAGCEMLAGLGMESAEAYPYTSAPVPSPGGLSRDALNYHGSLAMFLRSGFKVVGTADDITIVRRDLRETRVNL